MTAAALIVLDDDGPDVRILGLGWAEYRIRSAMRLGVRHIVVLTGRVTPNLPVAIDRARADGISIRLARSASEVGDLFHPDETVLLVAGAAIVDDAVAERLAVSQVPAIACLPPTADARFELIDSAARWAGLARIDGALVRRTAAAAGEWDLPSMLLRAAVAARATRIAVREEEVDDPLAGGVSGRAARQAIGSASSADGRLIGWIAARCSGHLPVAARLGPWLASGLLAVAPLVALAGFSLTAFALLLSGLFVAAMARRAARATTLRSPLAPALDTFARASAAAVVIVVAWTTRDDAVLILGVSLVGLVALLDRLSRVRPPRFWHATLARLAVVATIGAVFGTSGLFAAFASAAVYAFASLADLQNSLSRTLTSTR